MEPGELPSLPPPPPPPGPSGHKRTRAALFFVAAACVLSLIGNAALLMRGPKVVAGPVVQLPPVPAPICPECPVAPVCAVCEVCPPPPTDVLQPAPAGTATAHGTRPPRVDETAAAEGEAHLANAEAQGEIDPVKLAAQRKLADGVDRIVTSRSPRSAAKFITRNLPALASMDCHFRDPASAEHVRMRLRELNALLPEADRLPEAQLVRYERDLRCPRE